jgi:hypothetical protein
MLFSGHLGKSLLIFAILLGGCNWFCHAQLVQQLLHARDGKLALRKPSDPDRRHFSGRFLGWNFATHAHQDTGKWVGANLSATVQHSRNAAGTVSHESRLASKQGNASISFPYAGFGRWPGHEDCTEP